MGLVGSALCSAVTHTRFIGRDALIGEKLDICLADSPVGGVDDDRAVHFAQFAQTRGREFDVEIETARAHFFELRRDTKNNQAAGMGALDAFQSFAKGRARCDIMKCAAQKSGI